MSKLIPLTQGQFAIVDDEDYDFLMQRKWYVETYRGRASRVASGYGTNRQFMHRLITNAPAGMEVDHINRNPLDNRRANLRIATRAQNAQNRSKHKSNTSSQFKGVYWDKRKKRWQARIKLNRKFIRLGSFIHEIDAAKAYDTGARKYFGEFAATNLQ